MSSPALGRLELVDLRRAWASEPYDFTPWLAREGNLRLLGETVGLDLELESTEVGVGRFSADIVCTDTSSGERVLIENQLEQTDHSHLGQLLTYAAGLDARTIIWIARTFGEEHRAAIDWLNLHTDSSMRLFALEIELWQIGDSPLAPKFNIVSKPNDWSRTVKDQTDAATSPIKELQFRYWSAFLDYLRSCGSSLRFQKADKRHYLNHPLGTSGVHLAAVASSWNSDTGRLGSELRAEVILSGPQAKARFQTLQQQTDNITGALGFPLTWYNREGANMCRMYIRQSADYTEPSSWPEQFVWLREKLETLQRVFTPLARDLAQQTRLVAST